MIDSRPGCLMLRLVCEVYRLAAFGGRVNGTYDSQRFARLAAADRRLAAKLECCQEILEVSGMVGIINRQGVCSTSRAAPLAKAVANLVVLLRRFAKLPLYQFLFMNLDGPIPPGE